MASSLRDDLASLKIDRGTRAPVTTGRPTQRRRSDRGIRLLALVLWAIPLGLIGFAATYAYNQYEQVRAKPQVSVGLVQTMTTGEAEKLLSAKGYLKARQQAMIGTRTPGRVKQMFVVEGTKVKKGDLLAELEHDDLIAMLDARIAQVERTKAELQEARADLAEKEWAADRADRLIAKNMVSVEEHQKASATRNMARAKVSALEAGIRYQQAAVREIEKSIEYMKLYAPFDGTVVDKQGEIGEIINPMSMSSTSGRSAVVTLASLDTIDVETDVAESLLYRISEGQPAEVSVSAVPDRHYRGRLYKIIPMSDRTRGTVKVKVEVLDPDEKLFPELVATVHFLPRKEKGGAESAAPKSFVYVPKAAVFESDGHSYAWVVDRGAKVVRRQVEVAVTNDELARVESGLKPGETVVVNPPAKLREGETVKIAE